MKARRQRMKQRDGDQPLPVPNDRPCVQDAVVADIEARKLVGEEVLDLAMYLKQLLIERG